MHLTVKRSIFPRVTRSHHTPDHHDDTFHRLMDPAPGSVPAFTLDLIQTLALAAAVFLVGVALKRRVAFLDRLNIPSAVVGGLLFALLVLLFRDRWLNVTLENVAQPLFMIAFFTTIGMGASLPLLKRGGAAVVFFLAVSAGFCFVQNFVGMGIATLFGIHPLTGVLAGSVTLVGGPATGMAFAPLFENAGVKAAGAVAITAATFGIVCGGIIGGPVGTWLIRRYGLRPGTGSTAVEGEEEGAGDARVLPVPVEREDSNLALSMILVGIAMGIGSVLSGWIQQTGVTLPAYIGAMLVASVLRNIDDLTGWFRIDTRAMDLVGGIALNIFLVVAVMSLRLWELLQLAVPLTVILVAQVLAVAAFAVTAGFRLMGRDYDSAVIASGFIGFVLGTTANAVANMRALTARFGPSPHAFVVVPMVGAFFIDFVNALIINLFLNW